MSEQRVHLLSEDTQDSGAKPVDSAKQGEEEAPLPKPISYCKLYTYISGVEKVFLIVGTLASMATGVGLPLIAIMFGDITNDAKITDSDFSGIANSMKPTAYRMFYIGAAIFVTSYLMFAFWMMLGERVAIQIRVAYFRAVLRQDVEWFDTSNPQELSTKINQQCMLVQKAVGEKVATVIMGLMMLLTGLFIAFFRGWQMALILLALGPLIIFAMGLLTKAVQTSEKRSQLAYAKSGGHAEQAIANIRTVAAFGGEEQELRKYNAHLEESRNEGIKSALRAGSGIGVFWFTIFLAYGVGFYLGGIAIKNGWQDTHGNEYNAGQILTVFFSVIFGMFSFAFAAPSLRSIGEGIAAGTLIFQLIERQPKIDFSEFDSSVDIKALHGEIQLRNVHFAYPSRPDQPVLRNVSIAFQPGETTAIVGATGSGKSTIIQIIERFYDPGAGEVLLDGHDLKSLNMKTVRKSLIGYVGQEPVLFNNSILENIRFGKEDASEQEVVEALQQANAWDFVQTLDHGLHTNVGALGSKLSGGQKQRLAIARAIIKKPKILLLDEATSALDRRSEQIVQQALEKVSQGLTTIVIAHRLSTIQNADKIVALEKGQVSEIGTHAQLLQNDEGVYAKLVKAQIYAQQEEEDEESDEEDDGQDGNEGQGGENPEQEIEELPVEEPSFEKQQSGSPVKEPLLEHQVSSSRSLRSPKKKRRATSKGVVLDANAYLKEVDEEQKTQQEGLQKIVEEKKNTINARLFAYSKKFPCAFFMGLFSAMGLGLTFPLFALVFSEAVFRLNFFTTLPVLRPPDYYDSYKLRCLEFVIIGAASGVMQFLMMYFFSVIGQNITLDIRRKLYENILRKPVSWFDREGNEAGKLNSVLSADTGQLNSVTS